VAGGLTSAIGEALLELVEVVWPDAAPHVARVARQVADAVRPDPPFTVTTQDGELLTGILVLDRGRALLFFGTRNAATSGRGYRPPDPPDPSYSDRGFVPRGYEPDQSLWSPRSAYQR